MITQFGGAAGRADARRGDRILDRDRDTPERADISPAGASLVDRECLGAGPFGCERDDGVDRPVELLDAVQVQIEQLAGRHVGRLERGDDFGERRSEIDHPAISPQPGALVPR